MKGLVEEHRKKIRGFLLSDLTYSIDL